LVFLENFDTPFIMDRKITNKEYVQKNDTIYCIFDNDKIKDVVIVHSANT
jgi:hypothetical protein